VEGGVEGSRAKSGGIWSEVKTEEEYYRLRFESGLIRNPRRTEIEEMAEFLEKSGTKPEEIRKKIEELAQGRISRRTIYNHLPKELKRGYSQSATVAQSKEIKAEKPEEGLEVKLDHVRCPYCNFVSTVMERSGTHRLEKLSEKELKSNLNIPEEQKKEQTVKCKHCGFENSAKASQCPSCLSPSASDEARGET
jgi:DNA-directed RNA polymerase subunit RPC12/RpoP